MQSALVQSLEFMFLTQIKLKKKEELPWFMIFHLHFYQAFAK